MLKFRYRWIVKKLEKLPQADGITPVNVLALPSPLGGLIGEITREREMSLSAIAQVLRLSEADARVVTDLLAQKGYLAAEEKQGASEVMYRVYFAPMRKRDIPDL